MITGGTAGIGKHTAIVLVSRGARVVVGSRNVERGAAAVADINREAANIKAPRSDAAVPVPSIGAAEMLQCDLGSLASVTRFAEQVLALNMPIHALINNAGIMVRPCL